MPVTLPIAQFAASTDTILVRQVPPLRTSFEQVVFVAQGVTTLLLLVVVAMLIVGLVLLKRRVDALSRRLEALVGDVHDRVSDVGDSIDGVRDSLASVAGVAGTAMDGIRLGARAMGLGKRKKSGTRGAERPRVRRRDD